MKISYKWLKQYVDLPNKLKADELGLKLTMSTVEIEEVIKLGSGFDKVVVGKIIKITKHPNADKLMLCEVDVGSQKVNIVCGGINLREGIYTAVALPGATVRWHGQGEPVKLEAAVIRGEKSFGMICTSLELEISHLIPQKQEAEIIDLGDSGYKAGQPLAKALHMDDTIFDVDNKSLNHRPDLWSHYGIAREVAALMGEKLKPYETKKVKFGPKPYSIVVKDKKLCPRYAAVKIENVTIAESPQWLKDYLSAIGQRPINNIVDITNYILNDLGEPLHAFDADKLKGNKIIVRRAKKGEKMTTLDGQEQKLDDSMLVIADNKDPVALAGIMGGATSEVTPETKNILIEGANFDATNIRKTSTKLGLRTEASMRFEKALDPELIPLAMAKTVRLILEVCPEAKVVSRMVDIKNYQKKKVNIKIDPAFISKRIGEKIKADKMKAILQSLEFKVKKVGKLWNVEVPSFRATKDISIADDLVEEVARIYGYDNIEPRMPNVLMEVPDSSQARNLEHKLRNILALELGLDEVYNYSFMSDTDRTKLGADEEKVVRVQNPLSPEQEFLRTSLIPGILKTVAKNQNNFDEIKIFEIGRIYFKANGNNSSGEKLPEELRKICGALVFEDKSEIAFRKAKGVFEALFSRLKIGSQVRFNPLIAGSKMWQRGTTTNIEMNKKVIGQLGFINQKMALTFDLKVVPIVFNLDFKNLVENFEEKAAFELLPRFPSIELDMSMVVEKKVYWREIEGLIKNLKSDIIKGVQLFDVYEGKNVPQGKRSLAFRTIYRANDKTLTLEEAKQQQKKIVGMLKQKFNAEIRDK